MKFIVIAVPFFFIPYYSVAQKPMKIEMPHDTTIVSFTPKKENVYVILLDTIRLKNDFISDMPIRKFVESYLDSAYSLVSFIYIDYKKNKLILRNGPLRGKFDSICFNFCKCYVLNYYWKIKPSNKKYPVTIGFYFDLDLEAKTIAIDILGTRGKKSSWIFNLQIPTYAF